MTSAEPMSEAALTMDSMTVTAAAKLLGEHPADLRRSIRAGEVPTVTVGRQVRVLSEWARDPAGWRKRHLEEMGELLP